MQRARLGLDSEGGQEGRWRWRDAEMRTAPGSGDGQRPWRREVAWRAACCWRAVRRGSWIMAFVAVMVQMGRQEREEVQGLGIRKGRQLSIVGWHLGDLCDLPAGDGGCGPRTRTRARVQWERGSGCCTAAQPEPLCEARTARGGGRSRWKTYVWIWRRCRWRACVRARRRRVRHRAGAACHALGARGPSDGWRVADGGRGGRGGLCADEIGRAHV